jgi:hypothetical protein
MRGGEFELSNRGLVLPIHYADAFDESICFSRAAGLSHGSKPCAKPAAEVEVGATMVMTQGREWHGF